MESRDLAGKLWRPSLVRGLAALVLGAWVLVMPPASAGMLTRAVAIYWIIDGLAVFGGSLAAATLTFNRIFLVLRALAGIITAIVLLWLPLSEAFGPYRPGQLMLLLFVIPALVLAIGLQVLGAVFDLLVCLEVRRLIPGEWSVGLSATLSILFGALLISVILAPPALLGRGVGTVGVVGGLAVIVGAMRLRPRPPSLSAPAH